ncbi:MAG: aminoglycoside phosphotransferase family protein [Cyanophyceae cyanobacterium]
MMPPPQVAITTSLVHQLVSSQFPQWAHLSIKPVAFGGWDNRTFHLGDLMTVRLPSAAAYTAQVEKEHRWLPKLAPHLPLPIPTPLAKGDPCDRYPWPWSIYGWIEGETAAPERITDLKQVATALAGFLMALQRVDPSHGPAPGSHNFYRGGPLSIYDSETRQALAILSDQSGQIDTHAALAMWEEALASSWQGPPVWLHGDISPSNLLVKDGQLIAIIDFGCSAIGDPACDLAIAWTFFAEPSRATFRAALPLDQATWARGRGWALWKALITVAQQPGSDPARVEAAQAVLEQLLTT